MSSPLSALHHHAQQGQFGKPTDTAGVIFADMPTTQMVQYSAWPEQLSTVGKIAATAAGTPKAARPGEMLVGSKARMLRLEPLKWLLLHPDLEQAIDLADIPADQGSVLDVSSARSWITIRGEEATTLLNHFLPLDLREPAFPVGSMASTAFHHLNANLWREEDAFHLLIPRGFAVSLWEMLYDSALQYGLRVE